MTKLGLIVMATLLFWGPVSHGQWIRKADTRAVSVASAQDLDPAGFVYSSGIFTCNTIFETDTLFNNTCAQDSLSPILNSQLDMFVVKHDPAGNLVWSRQITGSQQNGLFINDMKVDAFGNTYIVGDFTDSLIASPAITLANNDELFNSFLMKLLPDGSTDWVVHLGGADSSFIATTRLDISSSEIVVTGTFRGELNLGADRDSVLENSMYLASFDLAGNPNWLTASDRAEVGSTGFGRAVEILGDSLYTLIEFGDSILFGTDVIRIPRAPERATALTVFDRNNGNLLWWLPITSDQVNDLEISESDSSLYLTGASSGITYLGTDTLFNIAGTRAFISSHRFDGTLKWAEAITSPDVTDLTTQSLSISSDDSVFVSGTFRGAQVSIGTESINKPGSMDNADIFMAKLDSMGSVDWIFAMGDSARDEATTINAFDAQTVYAAGFFSKSIRIAGDLATTEGGRNGFIAQLDRCPDIVMDLLSNAEEYTCENDPVTLQATVDPSYSYRWFKDGVEVAGEVSNQLQTDEAGAYYALLDNGSGCTKQTLATNLSVNTLPSALVSPADSLFKCAGDTVKVNGPANPASYQWFELGVGAIAGEVSPNFSSGRSGSFFLRATSDSLCINYSDTLMISVLDYPDSALNLSGRQLICGGDQVDLQAEDDPSFTYEWYKDDVLIPLANISLFSATESGVYYSLIKNSIGCESITSTDTVVVQNAPIIELNDASISPILCSGDSVAIITSNILGQTYQWRNGGVDIIGETGNSLTVYDGGSYTVYVQNATCDDESQIVNLTLSLRPPAIITNTSGETLCVGETFRLTANTGIGISYRWFKNGEEIPAISTSFFDAFEAGNYTVKTSNADGCEQESDIVPIVVNQPPVAFITPLSETTFCEGDEVTLRATPGTNLIYQWQRNGSPLSGENDILLTTSLSGDYTVEVTNLSNCIDVSEIEEVLAVNIPSATIGSNDLLRICERDSVELLSTVNPTYEYQWLLGGVPIDGANQSNFYAKNAGDYQSVVNVGICRDTSELLNLDVIFNPLPDLDRDEDFLSTSMFGIFQWYRNGEAIPDSDVQIYRVREDGFYQVEVLNNDGCISISDSISMCVPIPEVTSTNDFLSVNLTDRNYQWLFGGIPINGADDQTLQAQQSGLYSAMVQEPGGCEMETNVLTVCIPYPFITQDPLTKVLFANPSPAASYQWFKDSLAVPLENLNVLIPSGTGIYQVEITDFESCTSISEGFRIDAITSLEVASDQLSISPNPISSTFRINWANNPPEEIQVFDVAGNRIYYNLDPQSPTVDASSWDTGIYFVKVVTQENIALIKVKKN